MIEAKVTPRAGPLRCPYCHDDVASQDPCACGVVYHPECRAALGRCVTLGCTAGAPAEPRVRVVGTNVSAPHPREPWLQLDRTTLAVLLALAAAALGAAIGFLASGDRSFAVPRAVALGWDGLLLGPLAARAVAARSVAGALALAGLAAAVALACCLAAWIDPGNDPALLTAPVAIFAWIGAKVALDGLPERSFRH